MLPNAKLLIAQHNIPIGDFSTTLRSIETLFQQAQPGTLIVTSELYLTGYYPQDLLLDGFFQQEIQTAFESVLALSKSYPDVFLALGHPKACSENRFFNRVSVIENGTIHFAYDKRQLATYNVFDEARHLIPGSLPNVWNSPFGRIAFLICEDLWDGVQYSKPAPKDDVIASAPELIVCLNASPSTVGKAVTRFALASDLSRACQNAPVVYVNQVGGIDALVFDGGSFIVRGSDLLYQAPVFIAQNSLIDLSPENTLVLQPPQASLTVDWDFVRSQIRLGLRDYLNKTGFKTVVLGLSGGLDSALTLSLAVDALGADCVKAISMPSRYSSTGSMTDAQAQCAHLGVELLTVPIEPMVASFESTSPFDASSLARENLQARIRATVLMNYANTHNALLLTTGNKSEIALGYCTLYGDSAGALNLIGDLFKTQVFAFAQWLTDTHPAVAVPQAVIDKPPSAELAPGQTDEAALGSYDLVDPILAAFLDPQSDFSQFDPTQVQRLYGLLQRSHYKRVQSAPIIRLFDRSFGFGWQHPMAQGFRPRIAPPK